jgi:lysophospholipase L1-like esterase
LLLVALSLLFCEMLLRFASAIFEVQEAGQSPAELRDIHAGYAEKIAEYLAVEYRYTPYSVWLPTEFHGRFVDYDADGFRETVQPAAAAHREVVRVAFFGGSTMAGYGVADEETIPSLVARELSAMLPDVGIECYNRGVGAYNSTQELLLFYREVVQRGQRFDYAVFYDGINDWLATFDERDAGNHMFSSIVRRSVRLRGRHRRPGFWLFVEDLGRQRASYLVRYAGRALARLEGVARPVPNPPYLVTPASTLDDYADRVVDLYRKNLDTIAVLAERSRVEPVFVLQPTVSAYQGLDDELRALKVVEESREVVPAVYARWRQLAGRPGFLDLSDSLDSARDVFLDCCHVTERGNEIVAKRIAEYLASRIRAATQ